MVHYHDPTCNIGTIAHFGLAICEVLHLWHRPAYGMS
jgi:hypothetical protein